MESHPCVPAQFQSTHSLRSATRYSGCLCQGKKVSIHALLAECDQPWITSRPASCSFQSTHSLRSATLPGHMREPSTGVSIHALLAECDIALWSACSAVGCFNPRTPCGVRREGNAGAYDRPCFNPRTPCGVRPSAFCRGVWTVSFQSTHSLRSATLRGVEDISDGVVSIHALLAECD